MSQERISTSQGFKSFSFIFHVGCFDAIIFLCIEVLRLELDGKHDPRRAYVLRWKGREEGMGRIHISHVTNIHEEISSHKKTYLWIADALHPKRKAHCVPLRPENVRRDGRPAEYG